MKQRLALQFGEDIPALDNLWRQEIKLPQNLSAPPLRADTHHPFFSYASFTRMLYSCLVDADYLDTEAFYLNLENNAAEFRKDFDKTNRHGSRRAYCANVGS